MLEQIFLKAIDMSLSAGMIIVIVLIARLLLKRFPKYISYMLWSVVLFRLFCPITLESALSPLPSLKPIFYEYIEEKDAIFTEEPDKYNAQYIGEEASNVSETRHTAMQFYPDVKTKSQEVVWQELFILFGKYVWILGTGIMILYGVISAIKIRTKVSISVPLKENIYITDEMIVPFVMGIVNPRIYLPVGLNEKEQEYIILHEKVHIRRFDYIVKPIAYAALCIHWFNPLVWIAFILFEKDMEMSCDEIVIKNMGENIRADYSASLLALSTQCRIIRKIPVGFGEGNIKERVKNLAVFRKTKKGVLAVLVIGVAVLSVGLAFTHKDTTSVVDEPLISDTDNSEKEINVVENEKIPDTLIEAESLNVFVDITKQYNTHKGDPSNLYYIDKDNVLWGCGSNNCGQLGQGTQDYDFHENMVKIAENVVHVDYSQEGFVIFLTGDNKLYGMGNAGSGAMQQYEAFDWTKYVNEEQYTVNTPILLMEDIVYACCGRDDVVCLKEDGTVWTWGTIYANGYAFYSTDVYYIQKPQKILENAVLVTGGWFNHAALLQDGTVWTWGYNQSGNCGVVEPVTISKPTKVAEDIVMVWTDLAIANYPEPDVSDIAKVWVGSLEYNTDYDNIAELDDIYPKLLCNTVIVKTDGSYWVCGENVGTEEKVVAGAEADYTIICTHEFYLCE
ncbi:MAG: hypothetical protein NC313_14575 [Butyrivibrio sp.]|nr:hypothetical protein [Butyrivibrio sp.]